MKKTTLFALLVLSLNFLGCNVNGNDDECANVLCAGPAVLAFEVLQDMDNVFANGTFSQIDVTLSGEISGDLSVTLGGLTSGEPEGILFISNNNWMEGPSTFTISLPGNQSITVQVEIENSEGNCCGGIPLLASATVNGVSQELNGAPFTVTLVPN